MRAGCSRFVFQNLLWTKYDNFHQNDGHKLLRTLSVVKELTRNMCDKKGKTIDRVPPKVLVTHCETPKVAIEMLEQAGCDVTVCESMPPKRSEILKKCKGMDGLYWAAHARLNLEVLDLVGPQLKAVSTMSAGIDHIDVAELKKRNIPLGHTPGPLSHAVAETAIGLMLAAARRFHEGRQKIETATWETYHITWMLGQDIRSSVVGFYGFGRIGQAIALRLTGFEINNILYTARNRIDENIEKKLNASRASFDDMLTRSDIIFIVAPLTQETKGIFNAYAFDKMKKTAILVNVGRGQIVNQDDLYEALKSNTIFAAGLDVMVPEPLPTDSKLLCLPNCVLLPHLASATLRTRTEMSLVAAQNVLCGLAGKPMIAPAY